MIEIFGEPISVYSRADAIRDGVLIEVPADMRREAGILYPVAVTDHLWSHIEPDNLAEMPGQSVSGRLWDLLWMFRICGNRQRGTDRMKYRVTFQKKVGRYLSRETVTVIAVCGPGDYGEPVITLMLQEDE